MTPAPANRRRLLDATNGAIVVMLSQRGESLHTEFRDILKGIQAVLETSERTKRWSESDDLSLPLNPALTSLALTF